MTRQKDFGHKAPDVQFCQGYLDEHNHWNNGFLCPAWEDGSKKEYCCGTETHRYCCIYDIHQKESEATGYTHIYIIIGLVLSVTALIIISTLLTCYFIKCCPLYKRRKRYQNDYIVYDDNEVSTAFTPEQGPAHISGKENYPHYPAELQNIQEPKPETPLKQGVQIYTESSSEPGTCLFRNSAVFTTERDSGCYVSPTEYDSHTCLTDHDVLNEEPLWSPQNHSNTRYSWPARNTYEDVIPGIIERSETVENVNKSSSLSELCITPKQTRV